MSINALDPTSNDLLQPALDAQTKTDPAAAAQANAFQAQLQQTQGQQPATPDPGQQGHHHHHGGHHHGQVNGVGSNSSSAKSTSTQPSLLDMLNAIPTDLNAASDDAAT